MGRLGAVDMSFILLMRTVTGSHRKVSRALTISLSVVVLREHEVIAAIPGAMEAAAVV